MYSIFIQVKHLHNFRRSTPSAAMTAMLDRIALPIVLAQYNKEGKRGKLSFKAAFPTVVELIRGNFQILCNWLFYIDVLSTFVDTLKKSFPKLSEAEFQTHLGVALKHAPTRHLRHHQALAQCVQQLGPPPQCKRKLSSVIIDSDSDDSAWQLRIRIQYSRSVYIWIL